MSPIPIENKRAFQADWNDLSLSVEEVASRYGLTRKGASSRAVEMIRHRNEGKLNNAEIAKAMGFSHATIGKICSRLLEEGRIKPNCIHSTRPVRTYEKSEAPKTDLPLTPWNVRKELRELGCVVDVYQTSAGLLVYINHRAQAYTVPEQIDLLREMRKKQMLAAKTPSTEQSAPPA